MRFKLGGRQSEIQREMGADGKGRRGGEGSSLGTGLSSKSAHPAQRTGSGRDGVEFPLGHCGCRRAGLSGCAGDGGLRSTAHLDDREPCQLPKLGKVWLRGRTGLGGAEGDDELVTLVDRARPRQRVQFAQPLHRRVAPDCNALDRVAGGHELEPGARWDGHSTAAGPRRRALGCELADLRRGRSGWQLFVSTAAGVKGGRGGGHYQVGKGRRLQTAKGQGLRCPCMGVGPRKFPNQPTINHQSIVKTDMGSTSTLVATIAHPQVPQVGYGTALPLLYRFRGACAA